MIKSCLTNRKNKSWSEMIAWTKQCNNITKIQVMKMQIGNHGEWQSGIRHQSHSQGCSQVIRLIQTLVLLCSQFICKSEFINSNVLGLHGNLISKCLKVLAISLHKYIALQFISRFRLGMIKRLNIMRKKTQTPLKNWQRKVRSTMRWGLSAVVVVL